MRVVAVIPARMASTRLPGKPLANLLGIPMIEHVRRRTSLCSLFDEVVVATCDEEIVNVVVKEGGRVIKTANTHVRCTDRVAEAAKLLEADVVVNVQGDEPLLRPEMFHALLEPLKNESDLSCTNLMAEIIIHDDFLNKDVVKTVVDRDSNALYFSREPIPSLRHSERQGLLGFEQLGIIAFRKDFLNQFTALTPMPLEQAESVDMLRAVENGFKVRMVLTSIKRIGVDTPQDLERAKAMLENDTLYQTYK